MAKIIKMFECEYCHKTLRKTKKGIDNHENKCFYNEATKSCATCENFCDANFTLSVEEKRNKRKCYQGLSINTGLRTNCDCWVQVDFKHDDDELI